MTRQGLGFLLHAGLLAVALPILGCGDPPPDLEWNGSFEELASDGTILGWWIGSLPSDPHIRTRPNEGDAFEGARFVRLGTEEYKTLESPFLRSDEMPCRCRDWSFNLTIANRDGGHVSMRWLDATGWGTEEEVLVFPQGVPGWTTKTTVVTARSNTIAAQILLRVPKHSQSPPWAIVTMGDFDALSLVPVTPP